MWKLAMELIKYLCQRVPEFADTEYLDKFLEMDQDSQAKEIFNMTRNIYTFCRRFNMNLIQELSTVANAKKGMTAVYKKYAVTLPTLQASMEKLPDEDWERVRALAQGLVMVYENEFQELIKQDLEGESFKKTADEMLAAAMKDLQLPEELKAKLTPETVQQYMKQMQLKQQQQQKKE